MRDSLLNLESNGKSIYNMLSVLYQMNKLQEK
jgi:hypothetical protein